MNEVEKDLNELLGKGADQVIEVFERRKTLKLKNYLKSRLTENGITEEDLESYKEMRKNTSMVEENKDSMITLSNARINSKFSVPQRPKLGGYHRMNDEES